MARKPNVFPSYLRYSSGQARIPAKDFRPLALKAVRQLMVEKGWARNTINAAVGRFRRIFKHAVSNELHLSG